MENNLITSDTIMEPKVNEMKQRLGSKYIGENVTITDNISGKKFKIVSLDNNGIIIREIVGIGRGEETPLSFEDLLSKFDKSEIEVAGYENTESDKIIFHQVIREIMSGHTLAERNNAIAERDSSINELVTEESEFKSGGVIGKIKSNKKGIVTDIRNQYGKIISEVRVGDKIYKRGEGTYNAIEGNQALRKEDTDKIKIVKKGEKTKEKDKDKKAELEESAKRIIEHEIKAVQSSLVEKLLSDEIVSYDDIQNFYHFSVDNKINVSEEYMSYDELENYKEQVAEIIKELEKEEEDTTSWEEHLQELENAESIPKEVLEWWLISDWLKDKLLAEGEPVLDSDYGTWWGRTTSGQQIVADGIIQKIVKKINLDKYAKGKKIPTAKSITEDTRYNGWKNYETWNVKLWIDNEQRTQDFWNQRADEIYKEAKKSEYLTKKSEAAYALSNELKEDFDENNPLADQASTYSDLLGSALSNVDWKEIAENLLSEKKGCGGTMYEKGGEVGEAEWLVTLEDKDGFEIDEIVFADTDDNAYQKAEQRHEGSKAVGINMLTDASGKKIEYEKGGKVGQEFRYLKLIPKENGLEVKLTKEGKAKVKEDGLTYGNADEYFEDVQGNSEYIYHNDLGQSGLGMTSGEGITDGYHYADGGEYETEFSESAKLYWFPNHQIQFWGDILKDDGSVFFMEAKAAGGYMKKGGKVDITSNFYRFRQQSPKGVTECAVPEWGKKVAESVKSGAEITTCKKDDKWFVQSIMVPKEGVNASQARKYANEIKSKFSKKKKALGGVAETCTCEDIEKTKNGLKVLIDNEKDETKKNLFQSRLNDLN